MATLNPAVGENAYTETLQDVRNRLLRRMGYGNQLANLPPGVEAIANDYLQSAQTQLARQYPEMVTERFYEWTMVAGTRFYSVSGDDEGSTAPDHVLDPRRVSWVGLEDLNGTFTPLFDGIPPEYYTMESERGRPERYEIRQSIEVMPAPDQAYKLIVKGHTRNFTFTSDSDVCTIDPEAIFLHALANYKEDKNQNGGAKYFRQLTTYIGNLTAGTHGTRRYIPKAKRLPPRTKPNFTG